MSPMLEENNDEAQRDKENGPKVPQLRRGRGKMYTQAWVTQEPEL